MRGWIVPIVFLVLAVVLLCGKGGWLIAGYNTFSKDEKEKVDEKRLCRELGVLLLVLAVIKMIRLVTHFDFPAVQVSLVVVVLFFVYGGVKRKRKKK